MATALPVLAELSEADTFPTLLMSMVASLLRSYLSTFINMRCISRERCWGPEKIVSFASTFFVTVRYFNHELADLSPFDGWPMQW